MNCWKCEKQITEGSTVCPYCGVAQNRPAPTTEAGRALRALYDRYGAAAVLSNSGYVSSGIGDLMADSRKLRNQLKMAMDAGVGRLYLEQLPMSKPDADFDLRVSRLLTEEAGLNERSAREIAGYFDEMIGWVRTGSASAGFQAERQTAQRERMETERGAVAPAETDRTGRYTKKQPEAETTDPTVPPALAACALPEKAGGTASALLGALASGLLLGPVAAVAIAVVLFNLIPVLQPFLEPFLFGTCGVVIIWNVVKALRFRSAQNQFCVAREKDALVLSWPEEKTGTRKWAVAINDQWVFYGEMHSGQRFACPGHGKVLMAEVSEKTPPKAWTITWFGEAEA